MTAKQVTVRCGHCHGKGVVELTGVYADTLRLLRDLATALSDGETTGAELARVAGCKATAMNNRLAILEKHGLASSRRCGRLRVYKAKEFSR